MRFISILLFSILVFSCKSEQNKKEAIFPELPSFDEPKDIPNTENNILDDFLKAPLNNIAAPVFPASNLNLSSPISLSHSDSGFGSFISYHNNMLAVASDDNVFVYKKEDKSFNLIQTINITARNLELYNNTLVIIVDSDVTPNPGVLYENSLMAKVYKLENTEFEYLGKLTHEDPREADLFGMDLKITDSHIIVSTPVKSYPMDCSGENAMTFICQTSLALGTEEGAIYIFDRNTLELVHVFWGYSGHMNIGAKIIVKDNIVASMNLGANSIYKADINSKSSLGINTLLQNMDLIGNCIYKLKFTSDKIYFRPIFDDLNQCAYFNLDIVISNFNNFNFAANYNTFTIAENSTLKVLDFSSNIIFNLNDPSLISGKINKIINNDSIIILSAGNKVIVFFVE